eukprot:jgi/Bigna1/133630/aug1.22_g8338
MRQLRSRGVEQRVVHENHRHDIQEKADSGYGILTVAFVIFMDILYYSFPLPLLPNHLKTYGLGSPEVGQLAASASTSSLVAIDPGYNTLLISRIIMGGVSQVCWVFALALASTQHAAIFGIKAVAWLMLGNSAGELAGPLFGAMTYDWNNLGLRPPYIISSALMLLCTFSLSFMAVKTKPDRILPVEGSFAISNSTELMGHPTPTQDVNRSKKTNLLSDKYLLISSVRGSLDTLLPIFLTEMHDASAKQIGRVFGLATITFTIGSVMAALVLSPPVVAQTMIATSVIFALICGLSGFLGVSITTSIQRYANRLGKSEEAMGFELPTQKMKKNILKLEIRNENNKINY